MSSKKNNQIITYTGNGAFMSGLPARDMTLQEWETYPEAQRADALKLGLYQTGTQPSVMENENDNNS